MSKKDDYTFPEDTISTSEYSETAAKKGTENFLSILTNKRLMLPVGIFLFIFIVNFLFTSDDPVDEAIVSKIEDKPAVSEDIQTSVVNHQIPQNDNLIDQNTKMIGGVIEQSNQQKQILQTMDAKFVQLQKNVQSLAGDISLLQNQIRTTNANVDILRDEFRASLKPQKQVVETKPVVKLQTFLLQAVIEGRAWIRDVNDLKRTMTVAVGDSIPTYGKVVSINPVDGILLTSSGRSIQFPVTE
jgi:hypothetical protein